MLRSLLVACVLAGISLAQEVRSDALDVAVERGRVDARLLEQLDELERTGRIVDGDHVQLALRVITKLTKRPGDVTMETSRALEPAKETAEFARARQQAFVDGLPATLPAFRNARIRVADRFLLRYGITLEVDDRGALAELAAHPAVEHLQADIVIRPLTIEGRRLTGSDIAAAAGYAGQGIGVALIDTYYDLTHPELGGSTSLPNSVVVAGANTYDANISIHSTDLFSAYHGTGTAAIVRRYAPSVDLYCTTMFAPGTLSSNGTALINAIDWCTMNQAGLHGRNPIRVLSMSVGGGRFTSAIGNLFTLDQLALRDAQNAGIVCIASSGNDGYTDALGYPAASTFCISVGAVWDSNQPPYSPFPPANCTDTTRLIDERTCYSNTASFLDIYAPSEHVITARPGGGTQSLGGTSSACPAIAGLVAQLMSARPEYVANRTGIVSILHETGSPVVGDATKRRAYLPAAIDADRGAPCFETRLGTNLALTDDSFAIGLPLGFSFPWVDGTTTTAIDVCSNGFVYPFSNPAHVDTRCCAVSGPALTSGDPMIAALWTDLDPGNPGGGGVFFNTFDDPKRAVITWSNVGTSSAGGPTQPMTVQLQLFEKGSFAIFHDRRTYRTGNALVGVTEGMGAADPGETDLSTALPLATGSKATVYEAFSLGETLDLQSTVLEFAPNGIGGLHVSRNDACPDSQVLPYGSGCPAVDESWFYELFAPGTVDLSGTHLVLTPIAGGQYRVTRSAASLFDEGYANALPANDDAVEQDLALGFDFPYPGGSTNAIDLSTNGYVFLDPTAPNTHLCCNGASTTLMTGSPKIAMFGMDLAPQQGGAWYFDVLSSPTRALVTFVDVPEFNGTSGNTFQAQLHPDGTIVLSYRQVSSSARQTIVGLGRDGLTNVPTYDLTAIDAALSLGAAPGSRPAVGTTLTMLASDVPPTSIASVLILGLTPQDLDLSIIGMPRCTLLASTDSIELMTQAAPTATRTIPVPNLPILIGASLFTQAAALAPVNPFGIITSNGARVVIGR